MIATATCSHRSSPRLATQNESPLLLPALGALTDIAKAVGIELRASIVSFDGVYDSKANRKAIFVRRSSTAG